MRGMKWIAAILIFLLVFSFAYVGAESVHECDGEDCPVCAVLAVVTRVFTTAACFLFFVYSIAFVCRVASRVLSGASGRTLISLKVKLSD